MTYSYITNWLPKEDAQSMVKALINEGKFKKGEIKLSSYRWADIKDHSKGYVARVHVITGLHPEMELGLCGKKKADPSKKKATSKKKVEVVEEVEAEMNLHEIKLFDAVDAEGNEHKEASFQVELSEEQVKFLTEGDDSYGQYQMVLSYAEDNGWDEFDEFELVS